jgi:hypothetical protein
MPQQDCPLGSQFQFINARRLCSTPILISKYQLTRVPGQLRGEGPENFVIGDKNFATEKFILSFATNSGPRQIRSGRSNRELCSLWKTRDWPQVSVSC